MGQAVLLPQLIQLDPLALTFFASCSSSWPGHGLHRKIPSSSAIHVQDKKQSSNLPPPLPLFFSISLFFLPVSFFAREPSLFSFYICVLCALLLWFSSKNTKRCEDMERGWMETVKRIKSVYPSLRLGQRPSYSAFFFSFRRIFPSPSVRPSFRRLLLVVAYQLPRRFFLAGVSPVT